MSENEISTKALSEIIVISDTLPPDFYESAEWDEQLDQAIEVTENLVYTIDDEGEQQAKIDATSINKYVRTMDGFIAATYKLHTEKMQSWREGKKAKTKKLLDNRQKILTQFEEARAKKLKEIESQLKAYLFDKRKEVCIDEQFKTNADLSPILKLTGTLTPGGKLTTKANEFIRSIVAAEFAEQKRIEARRMQLENLCLKADINPPLTEMHFSKVDFYADDEIFNAKIDELLNAEVNRIKDIEKRIKAKLEEKQTILEEKPTVNDQLTVEKSKAEQLRESAKRITESAERAPTNAERQLNLKTAATLRAEADQEEAKTKTEPGKKVVMITACFYITGPESIANVAYVKRFMSILPEELKSSCSIVDAKFITDSSNEY